LNAERWAHHRTLITLRNETARRDQLDQQILSLKQECQALASEWSAATKNFVQCDGERLDLVREVQSLRSELEAWQFAYQELSGAASIIFD
jgi:chromosome segregation ATPase